MAVKIQMNNVASLFHHCEVLLWVVDRLINTITLTSTPGMYIRAYSCANLETQTHGKQNIF